jgi:uncharacterized phage protein (TIGR01671 family)
MDNHKFRVFNKVVKKYIDDFLIGDDGRLYSNLNNGNCVPLKKEFYKIEFCTGLKDKNGNLIYEGDIIKLKSNYDKRGNERVKHYINEVYFSTAKFRNCFCIKNGKFTTQLYGLGSNIEIIGNIHENPELLES